MEAYETNRKHHPTVEEALVGTISSATNKEDKRKKEKLEEENPYEDK